MNRLHTRLLIATMAMTAGCSELPTGARTTLADARQKYLAGDRAGAESLSAELIDDYPKFAETAGAHYLRALCRQDRGDKIGARTDLQQCIQLSKDATLTARARAMLGTLKYESGDCAGAVDDYAAAMKDLPEESNVDLVHYQYGICLQREGRWREGKVELATVFQRYPNSSVAEHARRLYSWPHEYFAIQCGAYRDTAKANEQATKLRRDFPDARVESRAMARESLSIVVVGKYPRWADAASALDGVRRKVSGAVIVP